MYFTKPHMTGNLKILIPYYHVKSDNFNFKLINKIIDNPIPSSFSSYRAMLPNLECRCLFSFSNIGMYLDRLSMSCKMSMFISSDL